MFKRLKHWRDLFYCGPRFLGITPLRRNGYQSPTLTAALWCYALIVRHLTLAGRIVFICSGLLTLYAMFSLLMPIHILAFGVLALFGVDMGIGLLVRPSLSVSRRLPPRMVAGGEQRVDYSIANRSGKPAWELCLDTLPFPAWVRLSRGRAYVDALAPGETAQASAVIAAQRRGRYTLPAVRVDSAFPFNLWRWGSNGDGSQRLTVYPAFTPLRQLQLETGVRYQPGGIAFSSNVGESMEFLSCREFRAGDDPRRLHWRSWARTSHPVVKEFRAEYFCRTALIVDTLRPRRSRLHLHWATPEDEALEAALSLAASVADFLAGSDYVVDLFAAGTEVYRFQGGRSLAYLENILDILACLQPSVEGRFSELVASLADELAQISSAVLILLCWDEARRSFIEEARAAGITVKTVLVTDSGVPPADLPASVIPLAAGDIRAGRCVSL